MKTLFATSELFPFNKTGGLGDVASALPKELKKNGIDIRYIIPAFPSVLNKFSELELVYSFENIFCLKQINIYKGKVKGNTIPFYLVDAPEFFLRAGSPYNDILGNNWNDNNIRFACFCYISAMFSTGLIDNWTPDIIHANDWMTSLIPLYLTILKDENNDIKTSSILTIHNIAHQNKLPLTQIDTLKIPTQILTNKGLLNNSLTFLKAGIHFADKITTVSPTYANEIQTEFYGYGLHYDIIQRKNQLTGILNGVDYSIWNPETDKHIITNYDKKTFKTGKQQNKLELQKVLNIIQNPNIPMFCILSRLATQKGIDILIEAIPALVMHNIQIVIMGTDQGGYFPKLKMLQNNHPNQVVITDFDEDLSHLLIAGSDILINPALYEPCGLTQIFAMKYGTIPIARKTGGLADSIINADFTHTIVSHDATGFLFDNYSVHDLIYTTIRALDLYQNEKKIWNNIIKQAMNQDFSWNNSASQYIDLYNTQLDLIK